MGVDSRQSPSGHGRVIVIILLCFGLGYFISLASQAEYAVPTSRIEPFMLSPSQKPTKDVGMTLNTVEPNEQLQPRTQGSVPANGGGPAVKGSDPMDQILSVRPLPPFVGDRAASGKVTVVLMSYPKSSRFHLLEEIICKCKQWDFVESILLVWNGEIEKLPPRIQALQSPGPAGCPSRDGALNKRNESPGPEDMMIQYPTKASASQKTENRSIPLIVLPQESNRIDNRWRIHQHIRTEAVLNMDDDINLAQVGAQCMLSVWKASPSSIVAVDVRSHIRHKGAAGPFGTFGYKARDDSLGYKRYSIALPRALLTHVDYYRAYDALWRNTSTQLRSIVDSTLCDDIGFNFVASARGAHVIYAKAAYRAYPESHAKDALTHQDGMKEKRQRCVNEFAASPPFASRFPLVYRRWHVLCDVDG
jgi:hypothetical protein